LLSFLSQLEDETEINAQVKIKFRATGGFPIVCTRQVSHFAYFEGMLLRCLTILITTDESIDEEEDYELQPW